MCYYITVTVMWPARSTLHTNTECSTNTIKFDELRIGVCVPAAAVTDKRATCTLDGEGSSRVEGAWCCTRQLRPATTAGHIPDTDT